MNRLSRQHGLSLVEIMVALAISTLLIAGVVQIFASNKATYRMQEGMARMQESARFALDFITRDIRQASYAGCTRNLDSIGTQMTVLLDPNNLPASFTPESGLQGWEFQDTAPAQSYDISDTDLAVRETHGNNNGWSGWAPAAGNALDSTPEVMPGSDILRVWHSSASATRVTSISASAPLTISVADGSAIGAGDIVLLSNCESAYVLQVCQTSLNGTSLTLTQGGNCGVGNLTSNLPAFIADNAELTPLVAGTYYIGKRGGDRTNPPSLYYAALNSTANDASTGRAEELAEGVESMQILYAEDIDSDGQPNGFRTAEQVADWRKVQAVKIGLLMRTREQIDTRLHGGEYTVNGTTVNITAQDRRPRTVFTKTIMLRNRST